MVLEEAWAGTVAGVRQVLFVGGEPGAGKSRLAAEVATRLHPQGAVVLLGSCLSDLGGPYEPFVEPLRLLRRWLEEQPGPVAVPTARARLLLDRVAGVLVGSTDGQPTHQRQLYDAVVDVVAAVAERCPVVLVLEDLHLAGPATLHLLGHLVERSAGLRLMVLATHRTTAADRSVGLVQAISALYALEGVRRVDLAGLDTEAIADYLVMEGGLAPGVARTGATLLRDATGGNPFFLRELWRDLASRGGVAALRTAGSSVPPSVRDTLHSRLQRLDGEHRRSLELAAVLGDDFDLRTLGEATGTSPQDSLEAVDAAAALGLLAASPGTDGSFHFLHSLARQAVLDLMPASRRAVHHARVAEVLERRGPLTDPLVQQLAHHFAGAQALGLGDRAVQYLAQAAGRAGAALAHRDSAALLERAAGLSTDPEEQDDLLLAAAGSHLMGADFTRARELFERVATSGTGVRRVRGAIGYELTGWRTGAPGIRAAELLDDRMADLAPDPRDPVYVRALAALGRALAYSGDDRGPGLCAAALAHARALGDEDLLGDVLEAFLGYGLTPTGAPVKLRLAEELSELAERTGGMHRLAAAAYNRAIIGYLQGDLAGVTTAHADLARAARLTGQAAWTYSARSIGFGRQLMQGDLTGALRTSRELLALGQATGLEDSDGPFGMQSFMVRRESGALEQLRGRVTGRERPDEHWAPGLLGLYTELRLVRPTARMLAWLLEGCRTSRRDTAQWPGVLALMVEAALWLGDAAAAARLRPVLADHRGLNLLIGAFDGPLGSADRYLAALDSLLGRGAPDDLFASALALDSRMDAPVHQAHTLALHVVHLRRVGAPAGEVDLLSERSRAIAEPLGLLRVLRLLDPPSTGRGTRADGLTQRELDVVRLLGDGLSNRDIARRLRISENTAANHVRSVLTKTGSANRTQAAMYGRERC